MSTTHQTSARPRILASTPGSHGRSHRLPQEARPPSHPSSLGPTPTPAAAPTASITADPLAIDLGQSVVLNWRTQNATVVTIDGIGEVTANGTQTVSPSNSTNFHLTAKGDGGTTEANVRVTVRVPVAPTAPADLTPADAGTEAAFQPERPGRLLRLRQLRPPSRRRRPRYRTAAAYLIAHPGLRVVIGGYCRRAWLGRVQPRPRRKPRQRRPYGSRQRRRRCQPAPRHQLRQGEAVLHRVQREPAGSRTAAPSSPSTANAYRVPSHASPALAHSHSCGGWTARKKGEPSCR